MASPLISDKVRFKVDHTKFYTVKAVWRNIFKYDDTEWSYLDKSQSKSLIALLIENPFVEDVSIFDNEGNVKHFSPRYDQTFANELLNLIYQYEEEIDEMKIKHRTNRTWMKIMLERKRQLAEAKLDNPNTEVKMYKGKVMIKGKNCCIEGSMRADGAEFPPDCEDWWK